MTTPSPDNGQTESPRQTAQDTTFDTAVFQFPEGRAYSLVATNDDGQTTFSNPPYLIKFGANKTFEVQSSESQFDQLDTFCLNSNQPGEANLQSLVISSERVCGDRLVYGGIGTVDIRPTLMTYVWDAGQEGAITMDWDETALFITAPLEPTTCTD